MTLARYKFAWIAASVVAGGIVLGAVTAPLFAPVPKTPAEQSRQLSGRTTALPQPEPAPWPDPAPADVTLDPAENYAISDPFDGEIWQYPAPSSEAWEPESALTPEKLEPSDAADARDAAYAAEDAVREAAEAIADRQSEMVRKANLGNGLY